MTTRTRPNANPILAEMRDSDWTDPWGTAMGWGFAVCEVLYDADPNAIPPGLGYSPSIAGPLVPGAALAEGGRMSPEDVDYETARVWEWLHQATTVDGEERYWSDPTFNARFDQLVTAARCLDRYLDWLKAAGLDY